MVKENVMKQTEIGLLPEDWTVKIIAELINEISMGPFGSDIKVSNFVSKGVPVLNAYNVSGIRLKSRHSNFVTTQKAKSLKKAIAKRGDVVVTHRGTIGQIAYIPNNSDYMEYVISQSQFRFSLNQKKATPEFLVYFFHSSKGQQIIEETKGHTGVPAIAQATTTFKKIAVPIPSLTEQEAIAESLSDVDTWLESLEKLIAKKRLIKQGAMQELLRPKEDWEVKKLGECLDYLQPTPFLVKSIDYNPNNDIPVLTAGKTFILGYTNEIEGVFLNLPTIIFDDFTTATQFVDFPFKAKSSAMKMLILKNNQNDIRFLYQLMANLKFQVGDHKRHWIGEFANLEIHIPSLPEQTRIANILSDMDAELEALAAQLEKARKIKHGMMQELLTGRIRLV